MAKKKKTGRPKKAAKERLDHRVDVRFSKEDRKIIEKAAKLDGLDVSKWVRREAVLNAQQKIADAAAK